MNPTPTEPEPTPTSEQFFELRVSGGTGDGTYACGTVVGISATACTAPAVHTAWSGGGGAVTYIGDDQDPTTTFGGCPCGPAGSIPVYEIAIGCYVPTTPTEIYSTPTPTSTTPAPTPTSTTPAPTPTSTTNLNPTPTEPDPTPTDEIDPTPEPTATPDAVEWYLNGAGPYEAGDVVVANASGLCSNCDEDGPCTGPGDTYVWTCNADLTDNGDTADVTSYTSGNYTVSVTCDYAGCT